MLPIVFLIIAGMSLFVGYMVGSRSGEFFANTLAASLPAADLTRIVLIFVASVGFSLGTAGIAYSALVVGVLAALFGGVCIGLAFTDSQLDPIVGAQARAVWRGAGVAGTLPFLPGWAHDRTATFLLICAVLGAATCGLGFLIRYGFYRMIARSEP